MGRHSILLEAGFRASGVLLQKLRRALFLRGGADLAVRVSYCPVGLGWVGVCSDALLALPKTCRVDRMRSVWGLGGCCLAGVE